LLEHYHPFSASTTQTNVLKNNMKNELLIHKNTAKIPNGDLDITE
jgi:hypothetical protein